MDNVSPTMRFSSASIPAEERASAIREVFGRGLVNLDLDPLADQPDLEVELYALPGIAITCGRISPHTVSSYDPSRERDDFALAWSRKPARGRLRHIGREYEAHGAAAILTNCGEPFVAEQHSYFFPMTVRIERTLLAPLLPKAEDALMRPIPTAHFAMRLLEAYVGVLRREGAPSDPAIGRAVSLHICDLVALAVGTTRDAEAFATERGLRAARLVAVKKYICDRLHDPALAIADVAKAHRLSPRSIQLLFESEGTTFSALTLKERLLVARRHLANPLFAARQISTIAFDVGFNDLSYFNRAFKAAFGETPSDVRQRALQSRGRLTS